MLCWLISVDFAEIAHEDGGGFSSDTQEVHGNSPSTTMCILLPAMEIGRQNKVCLVVVPHAVRHSPRTFSVPVPTRCTYSSPPQHARRVERFFSIFDIIAPSVLYEGPQIRTPISYAPCFLPCCHITHTPRLWCKTSCSPGLGTIFFLSLCSPRCAKPVLSRRHAPLRAPCCRQGLVRDTRLA